jgi:ketol-acid reductoisomerase
MEIILVDLKVITEKTKEAMKEILENIQSGNFANEFLNDCRQSNDGSGWTFHEK